MIINCEATPLIGKADALALPSTQSSPTIMLITWEKLRKIRKINRTPIVKKEKEILFGWSLTWVSC
jgi:hypothetical protein